MADKGELGPVTNGLLNLAGVIAGLVSLAPWIIGAAFLLFLLVKMVKMFWYA